MTWEDIARHVQDEWGGEAHITHGPLTEQTRFKGDPTCHMGAALKLQPPDNPPVVIGRSICFPTRQSHDFYVERWLFPTVEQAQGALASLRVLMSLVPS